jgi:AhpC/TSA family
MYPHERSLVAQYEAETFAILGVNSDPDRERIREIVKEKGLTWRNWWDGGTDGPIATRWNVRGWPTVYIIDHEGVIRARDAHGERIDKVIEELVPIARAAAKQKKMAAPEE